MLKMVVKWLTGDLAGRIADAYQAKQRAKTDRERLKAEQRIAMLEGQRTVLVEEQRHRLTRWIRPAIAAPFAIYIWKVVFWDKVLGLGTTDPLSAEFSEIMMVVLGAYFLARPFEKWLSR